MSRPALELADIVRRYGASFRAARRLTSQHLRVLRAIELCRTAALGGHVQRCDQCPYQRISYNSCRNRHCPKCQSLARARWLAQRQGELLPVPYFHVVFTVPEPIASIALQNKKTVYNILFRAAAQTLLTIAADPKHLGANIGFFAILHTWGQNLLHHPHLHCVVPGGGLSPDGDRWIGCRPGFFLPVRVLSTLFRRLFLEALEKAFQLQQLSFFGSLESCRESACFQARLAPLRQSNWVVYAKPPFGGPLQVLDYLGRYTHRVALSNDRLQSIDQGYVRFRWKDYRHHSKIKSMTLDSDEFLRRFLLHTLPAGFQRIRHYGLLSNRNRPQALELCRHFLATPLSEFLPSPQRDFRALYLVLTAPSPPCCPQCRRGLLRIVEVLLPLPRSDICPQDSS